MSKDNSKEMEICMWANVLPPDYGGGGKAALRYAKMLTNMGHRVTIFSSTKNPQQVEETNINTYYLRNAQKSTNKIYKVISCLALFIKLIVYFDLSKFDVIHLYSTTLYSCIFSAAANISGVRTVMELNNSMSDSPSEIKKEDAGWLKLYLISYVDCYIAVSPNLKDKCERSKYFDGRCYLVQNTIDPHQFKSDKSVSGKPKMLSRRFDNIIVSVGILNQNKNQEEILRIFELVENRIPSSCLVLVGPKSQDEENKMYTDKLVSIASKCGLRDKLFMTGLVDNVDIWLNIADVFLFSSKSEGLPLSVLEAMSCGVPCVIKKLDTTSSYIINHTRDGYIYDDIKQASTYVLHLIENPDLSNKVSNNARNKVLKKFTHKIKVNKYIDIYSKMCNIK
ncbi:MAG: glycosyltransferase [Candidatus Paceibacteria bacterium]